MFEILDFTLIGRRARNIKAKLAMDNLVFANRIRKGMTTLSITRYGWFVMMKSMQVSTSARGR